MDWVDPVKTKFTSQDLANFQYVGGTCTIIEQFEIGKSEISRETTITSENQWEQWLKQCSLFIPTEKRNVRCGYCFILCHRADDLNGTAANLKKVPISEKVFKKVCENFHLHRDVLKRIVQSDTFLSSTVASVADAPSKDEDVTMYTGRTKKEFESSLRFTSTVETSYQEVRDIAISVTYMPKRNLSLGIFFSCRQAQIDEIKLKLGSCGHANDHKLLLVGVFVELQFNRLRSLVNRLVDEWISSTPYFTSFVSGNKAENLSSEELENLQSLRIDSKTLMTELKAARIQAAKIHKNHFEDDPTNPHICTPQFKTRFEEIEVEYEKLIDDCLSNIEEMHASIDLISGHLARKNATESTKLAEESKKIAQSTSLDSKAMKAIAGITVMLLPPTSIATIIAMPLWGWDNKFQWKDAIIWGALTLAGLGVCGIFLWRYLHRVKHNNSKNYIP